MVALNYRKIKWKPERVVNIEPFINEYNWDGIRYPSEMEDWKNFERNYLTIALNVLYEKEMQICLSINQHVKNKKYS